MAVSVSVSSMVLVKPHRASGSNQTRSNPALPAAASVAAAGGAAWDRLRRFESARCGRNGNGGMPAARCTKPPEAARCPNSPTPPATPCVGWPALAHRCTETECLLLPQSLPHLRQNVFFVVSERRRAVNRIHRMGFCLLRQARGQHCVHFTQHRACRLRHFAISMRCRPAHT